MPVIAIAGLGLIGGSIGMACRREGWEVWFHDPGVSCVDATRAGAADREVGLGGFSEADLVVLATPLDAALRLLPQLTSCRTVMSVCSLMQPIVAARQSSATIATHPMAGSERSSLSAANGELFRGRTWFVERAADLPMRLIDACGASAAEVSPEEHDRAMTLTSQLPQLLSTALAALVAQNGVDERFIGTGFRTFARLAGSTGAMWQPLFEANREELESRLTEVIDLARRVGEGDAECFTRANALWARLNPPQ